MKEDIKVIIFRIKRNKNKMIKRWIKRMKNKTTMIILILRTKRKLNNMIKRMKTIKPRILGLHCKKVVLLLEEEQLLLVVPVWLLLHLDLVPQESQHLQVQLLSSLGWEMLLQEVYSLHFNLLGLQELL